MLLVPTFTQGVYMRVLAEQQVIFGQDMLFLGQFTVSDLLVNGDDPRAGGAPRGCSRERLKSTRPRQGRQ